MIISYESYGCTMNHGEARLAAQMLLDMGIDVKGPVDGRAHPSADIVLLFTCDVIETTERRMWRRMAELSAEGKDMFIAGCLASIEPEAIKSKYPRARIFGSMGTAELMSSVRQAFGDRASLSIGHKEAPPDRLDTIVPISTGCLGSCTYCITREARGALGSYPVESILRMIRKGAEAGRKEVLLTSQDTGAYGADTGGEDLGGLLREITGNVEEDIRIRVGMMNPVHLKKRLGSILRGFDDPMVFKFFHIPVQSGSDEVLRAMGRGYSVDDVRRIISTIRQRFPSATISTDVIVAFPGERDEDHLGTISLLEEMRPDVLNITRFSSRTGTPAALMENKVKGGEMKRRSREISKLHRSLTAGRLKERLGFHRGCLVTEIGRKGTMMARDENYTPIVFKGGPELLGTYMDIRSDDRGPTYLIGSRI